MQQEFINNKAQFQLKYIQKPLTILFTIAFGHLMAQVPKPVVEQDKILSSEVIKSAEQTLEKLGDVNLTNISVHYNPALQDIGIFNEEGEGSFHVDKTHPLPQGYESDHTSGAFKTEIIAAPFLLKNLGGNVYSGYTPPDNDVAVSNAGYVISVANSNYVIYKPAGGYVAGNFSDLLRSSFPSLGQTFYDPRVLYDPISDRFVIVILHGSKYAYSYVLALFSKTNNPLDGWNMYALKGDALNTQRWFDYPNIAVNNNELFISGNLFTDGEVFDQALVFQINKADGYSGNKLTFQTWSGIKDASGVNAFTLIPAPYGLAGYYGPGIYFVSNTLSSSNKLSLFELTDIISAPDEKLNLNKVDYSFYYQKPTTSYMKDGTGISTQELNCGDTRIKKAFMLDNVIHFVFSSSYDVGYTGIFYCRLDLNTFKISYKTFGESGFHYAFPCLASMGTDDKDKTVFISFERSGQTAYPELRTVACDANFNFSPSTLVQVGSSDVDILSDTKERWGDYTSIARKYNSNSCLMAGCFGSGKKWATRVEEISDKSVVGIESTNPSSNLTFGPNPIDEYFSVKFNLKKEGWLKANLIGINGQETILHNGYEKEGLKEFRFDTWDLASGNYILNISDSRGMLLSKKLVITH